MGGISIVGAGQWRLQDADAQDVAQEILLKLARKLRSFAYGPQKQLRGWLKTVAHHAWRDFVDGRDLARPSGDERVWEVLHSVEAREDLLQKLEEAFDYETIGSGQGTGAVCGWPPAHWEAFRLVALEGIPAVEVAAAVHMQVAMVYVAKSKVQRMLTEEIQKTRSRNLSAPPDCASGACPRATSPMQ